MHVVLGTKKESSQHDYIASKQGTRLEQRLACIEVAGGSCGEQQPAGLGRSDQRIIILQKRPEVLLMEALGLICHAAEGSPSICQVTHITPQNPCQYSGHGEVHGKVPAHPAGVGDLELCEVGLEGSHTLAQVCLVGGSHDSS